MTSWIFPASFWSSALPWNHKKAIMTQECLRKLRKFRLGSDVSTNSWSRSWILATLALNVRYHYGYQKNHIEQTNWSSNAKISQLYQLCSVKCKKKNIFFFTFLSWSLCKVFDLCGNLYTYHRNLSFYLVTNNNPCNGEMYRN